MLKDLTLVHISCPRFLRMDFSDAGFGDQVSRLIYLYTVASISNATVVVDDNYGRSSIHKREGYKELFDKFGFPPSPLSESEVNARYPDLAWSTQSLAKVALQKPSVFSALPCGSGIRTSIYSCGFWCPLSLSHFVEIIAQPVIAELIEARHPSLNERISPLRIDRLNIVWHVRTGDICLRCSDTVFFNNVKAFLRIVTLNVPSQNIIVHQRDERISAIFNASRDTILYADKNPENAVKLFLNADILVVTGSSFPAMVAWLTPLHQPLVLLSEKKEHFFGGDENVKGTLYDLSEGRAIRLANDGQVLNYKSRDLTTLLRMKGVIQRVKRNQPLPRAGAYIYNIRYGILVFTILLLLFARSRSMRLRLKVKQSN